MRRMVWVSTRGGQSKRRALREKRIHCLGHLLASRTAFVLTPRRTRVLLVGCILSKTHKGKTMSVPRIFIIGPFGQSRGTEPLGERIPKPIDLATLPEWFRSLDVRLEMGVPNVINPNVTSAFRFVLQPKDMTSLTPEGLVSSIPALAAIKERMLGLRGIRNILGSVHEFRMLMNALLVQPDLRSRLMAEFELPTIEPDSVLQRLLDAAAMDRDDEQRPRLVLAIRHILDERFEKRAMVIEPTHVMAEAERLAALLAAQVSVILQEPAFVAIERAWWGLEAVMRQLQPARFEILACTVEELNEYTPDLFENLHQAKKNGDPYAAAFASFDVDIQNPIHCGALGNLAWYAINPHIPMIAGVSDPNTVYRPLLVPILTAMPVRAAYGDEEGQISTRTFPFREPAGGPPTARWITGAVLLARELNMDPTTQIPDDPGLPESIRRMAIAVARSRGIWLEGSYEIPDWR